MASGGMLTGLVASMYDDQHLQLPLSAAAASQAMTQPFMVMSGGGVRMAVSGDMVGFSGGVGSPLTQAPPQSAAMAAAAFGLQALQLEIDPSDPLGQLTSYGPMVGEDAWAMAASSAGAVVGGQQCGLLLAMPQQQLQLAQQAPVQQLPGVGANVGAGVGTGGPGFMPSAPRAPRMRRHSMFVATGHDPRSSRRSSVGSYDSVALMHQQAGMAPGGAASAAVGGLAGAGGSPAMYAPIQGARPTTNGYHLAAPVASGLASAAIAERMASTNLSNLSIQPQVMATAVPQGPMVQQQQLLGPSAAQQQQAQWAAAGMAAGAGSAYGVAAPRAPSAVTSRRHSWCPSTMYYSPDGPRAALQTRLAYRAAQAGAGAGGNDALAALQLADCSIASSYGGGSVASFPTPGSSVLLSQPASPMSSNSSRQAVAQGLIQYVPGGGGEPALAPQQQYVLLSSPQQVGGAGGTVQYAVAGDAVGGAMAVPAELLAVNGASYALGPDVNGGLDGSMMFESALLMSQAPGDPAASADVLRARQLLFADRWDYTLPVAQSSSPVPGARTKLAPRPPPVAVRNGVAAAAAATAAALPKVAPLPVPAPLSKVCGDAKWELKRSTSDPTDTLASLESLTAWLESRRTLEGERLREERRFRRAAARAAAAAGATAGFKGADGAALDADAAFAYALEGAGDDTWGGGMGMGAAAAVAAARQASAQISTEPSNKLFVGNIGWWVTEEDLQAWFSRFGTVTGVKIMYNSRKMHKPKDKWRSREYGFVDFATPEEAARAIVWMDGVELPELMKDNAGIIVQYAKPAGSGGMD